MKICKQCQHCYDDGGECYTLRCKKSPLPIFVDHITGEKWARDSHNNLVHISKPHEECVIINPKGKCKMWEQKEPFSIVGCMKKIVEFQQRLVDSL